MATVRYYLRKHPYGTIIVLVFRFNGMRFVYYPGFTVIASDWNKAKQDLRKGAPLWQEINAGLSRLKNEVERLYTESLGGDHLNPKILKFKVDMYWKGLTVQPVGMQTLPAFARSLAQSRFKSGEIQLNTKKATETLASQIERFDSKATFEDVTIDWYNRFTAFMNKEGKSHNTIASRIKRLKAVMTAAIDAGLTQNRAFESSRFVAKEIEVDNIYLTEADIKAIEQLSSIPLHLEKCKDLFLLGVYTGLRYSDFSTLTPGDFHTHDGVFMVRKRMKKTKRVIAVPVSDKALVILNKYSMKVPDVSNQVLNRALKEICRAAGLDEMVKVTQTKGGAETVRMVPKWSMVTTHTARRSFATLEYLRLAAAGLPIDGLMEITGHKTRTDFLKYIKVGAVERAALWAKAGG